MPLPCHLVTTWQKNLHTFLDCFALFFCIFMHSAILFEFFAMTLGGRGQRLQELLQKFIKLGLSYTTFWGPFRAILFCCLPPAFISEKYVALFCDKLFGLKWPHPFPKIHCFFPLKITTKNATKSEMTPPPPLEIFWKFIEIRDSNRPLRRVLKTFFWHLSVKGEGGNPPHGKLFW